MIVWTQIDSPVGPLTLAASDAGLHMLEFAQSGHPVPRGATWQEGDHPILRQTETQLQAYFSGTLCNFELPLAPQGTPFQCAVWMVLASIPYGQTITYAEQAARIKRPRATRAVGAANGRNPISIVLPCHRVIGTNGALTGYGGGLPVKQFLLRLEGVSI